METLRDIAMVPVPKHLCGAGIGASGSTSRLQRRTSQESTDWQTEENGVENPSGRLPSGCSLQPAPLRAGTPPGTLASAMASLWPFILVAASGESPE